MYLINGQRRHSLPASDRAIQFGDGCFTSAAIINGKIALLSRHIQRLQQACQRLAINGVDWPTLNAEMCQIASDSPRAVLKVIITRGSGGRGYQPPPSATLAATGTPADGNLNLAALVDNDLAADNANLAADLDNPDNLANFAAADLAALTADDLAAPANPVAPPDNLTANSAANPNPLAAPPAPRRLLCLHPWPAHYDTLRERGVQLALSPIRLGRNPWLAGIKHLNRLEQVLIRQHLAASADEALVLDSEGLLIECCAANLFWRQGEQIFTPRLDDCGVNGIMRQHIISLLTRHRWPLAQVRQPLTALASADEIIICNALMPVLPVRQAHHWTYSPGRLYQFLAPLCQTSEPL